MKLHLLLSPLLLYIDDIVYEGLDIIEIYRLLFMKMNLNVGITVPMVSAEGSFIETYNTLS